MNFNYVPKRLIQSKEDIVILHANKRTPVTVQPNNDLMTLITRLVSLELYQIKKNALALTEEETMKVAGYLPYNYYNVEMKNLFLVFQYRSNKRLCEILYNEWQDSYTNSDCNKYMKELLNDNEKFILTIRDKHLNESDFKDYLSSDDIAIRFGKETAKYHFKVGTSLKDKLNYFGIRSDSRLYHDCEFMFYTYCSKADYIAAGKNELLAIIKKYGPVPLKEFLKNFLSKLELKEMQKFTDLAKYLTTQTGENHSEKFNSFFKGFDDLLIEKYVDWINVYKVYQYFGDDERSMFWKQYKFRDVKRYAYSNAVVMEFKRYYAVEFLGYNMGPIYIYEKDIFENTVRRWFSIFNNTDLRSQLYHSAHLYFYRKAHQGYWQYDVNDVLLRNRITERIII